MIASISGTLAVRDAGRVIVEAGGIGYEVNIPLSTYYRLPGVGDRVTMEIRHVVREESITLYGFATAAEKRAFDLLMLVQHVGPKLGLAILSVLAPDELYSAIANEDADRLDSVPGVGPKVAERVVRELRDKIAQVKYAVSGTGKNGSDAPAIVSGPSLADDATSALVNLGLKPVEARRTVEAVIANAAGDAPSLEVTIRKSLAVMLAEK
jgi:Holliday junction DNA helicase RuvA